MPDSSLSPGSRGDFLLLGEIARGASGVVWHAVRISLNRPCALKFLLNGHLASETDRARFKAEAEATAALDHPAIVRIYGSGDLDGHPYLEMELLSGETLADRIAAEPPSWSQCAQWLQSLSDGLAHAHARGVLHRDIKPSNILLTPDDALKLGDFGLARMFARPTDLTATFGVVGTPIYLAPEIAREGARAASTASDLFSLGAVFHQMLVGRPPRTGTDPIAILSHAQQHPLPAPGRLRTGIPADLDVLCQRCTAEDPTRRIPSARHLADELQRHLDGQPIQSRPPALLERLLLWISRHRFMASLIAVAVMALVASATVAWNWRLARERDAERFRLSILKSLSGNQRLAADGMATKALLGMAGILRQHPDHDPTRQTLAHWLSLPDFCPMPLRVWPHDSGARKVGYSGDEQSIWIALDDGRVVVRPAPSPASPAVSPPLSTNTPSAPIAFAVSGVGPESLASLNHDGTRLLTWLADRRLVQWTAPATPSMPPTVEWELPNILHAALSADRSHWIALSRDGHLWSASILSNAAPIQWNIPPVVPRQPILAIANAGQVVALSPDRLRIRILRGNPSSPRTNTPVLSLPSDAEPFRNLLLSPQGFQLLGVAGRAFHTWTTRDGKPGYKPALFAASDSFVGMDASGNEAVIATPQSGVRGLAIQRDGHGFTSERSRGWPITDMALGKASQVAVVTQNGHLFQKHTREGNFVSSPAHRSPARAAAFSPSGKRILVAHADGHVVEFPTLSGLPGFLCAPISPHAIDVQWMPEPGRAAIVSKATFSTWDPAVETLPMPFTRMEAPPLRLAFLPALGRFLALFDNPNVVEFMDPKDASRAIAWTVPDPVDQLWAHPSSPHAMAAGPSTLHAREWNRDRWLDRGSFPVPIHHVVFHPSKPEAILLDTTGQAHRWVATGNTSMVLSLKAPFPVSTAAVTPDGTRVLWASKGTEAIISSWAGPLQEGFRLVTPTPIRAHAINDIHVGLASGSSVSLWKLDHLQAPASLINLTRNIDAIAFSPDSRCLAIHADFNWVRFHDTATGEQFGRIYNLQSSSRVRGPWNILYHPGGTHLWGWSSKGGLFSLPQPRPLPSTPAWTPVLIDLAEHIAQDPIPLPTDLPTRQSRLQRLRSARTQGLWRPEWDRYLGEE